jgi:hypothetical protein
MSTSALPTAPPPAEALRAFVRRGRGVTLPRVFGLAVFALPGAGFVAGLFAVRGTPAFLFLEDARTWPWELWTIAVAGSLAFLGGVGDFFWHVRGLRDVSRKEERGEILALATAGAPTFLTMAAASVAPDPRPFLTPGLRCGCGARGRSPCMRAGCSASRRPRARAAPGGQLARGCSGRSAARRRSGSP